MKFQVRYTKRSRDNLLRLFRALAEKNLDAAHRAMNAIEKGTELLTEFPFSCRKVSDENPFLREILISFGNSGYVALFEIEKTGTVTILAIRHQREDDYY